MSGGRVRRDIARRDIGDDGRAGPRVGDGGALYAAIDLGTHNCRLLIAEPRAHGCLAVFDAFARPVRLGEGLAATGCLGEDAMRRAVDALSRCVRRIGRLPVAATRAIATEACRRASNTPDFFARVHAACGLSLEPISAGEEARLTLSGCTGLMDPRQPHVLLFDIGGGSTEVVWAEQRPAEGPVPLASLSIAMGVVSFAERFGGDRVTAAEFAQMVREIDVQLTGFDARHAIGREIARSRVQMVGTSGTVTTLAALSLGIGRYRRTKVDGHEITFAEIARLSRSLAATDWRVRAAIPAIGPERADLVVAGCAILTAICRRWSIGRITVADRGLREGMILAMHAARTRLAKETAAGRRPAGVSRPP